MLGRVLDHIGLKFDQKDVEDLRKDQVYDACALFRMLGAHTTAL